MPKRILNLSALAAVWIFKTLWCGTLWAQDAVATENSPILISELRASGPQGAEDGYIELANSSEETVNLGGWSLHFEDAAAPTFKFTVPQGTSIAARGHLLFAGRDYSLQKLVPADVRLERAFRGGVQLHDAQHRVRDAVGPRQATAAFREGVGLPDFAFARQTVPYACVRRVVAGDLNDSNDNQRDFFVVSIDGTLGGNSVRRGVPGPENQHSPRLYRPLKNSLVTQKVAPPADSATTQTTGAQTHREQPVVPIVTVFPYAPLRDDKVRGINKTYGTLLLRCRFVNISAQTLSKLQFRINAISNTPQTATLANQAAENNDETADLRFLPLAQYPVIDEADQPDEVLWEARLDEPPTQNAGGGLNSSVTIQMPAEGLPAGDSGYVQWLLGVERPGRYRVVLDGENFRVAFSGDTEKPVRPEEDDTNASNAADVGARHAVSEATGNRKSANFANTGTNATTVGNGTAGAPRSSTAESAPTVYFVEGHTEDGVENPAQSAVKISSFRAQGRTIALRFNGPLDPTSVAETEHFNVELNGESIAIARARYDEVSQSIFLEVGEDELRRGATIAIQWNNLQDAQGRSLSGRIGPFTIP